jgi:hypothetical protein
MEIITRSGSSLFLVSTGINALTSGRQGFQSRPRDIDYPKISNGIPQSLEANSGQYLKSDHEFFLSHSLQFTIHYHPIIRRYTHIIQVVTASLNKLTNIRLIS